MRESIFKSLFNLSFLYPRFMMIGLLLRAFKIILLGIVTGDLVDGAKATQEQ